MFHRIIFRWLKRGIDACKALRTSILKMKPKNLEIQVAIVLLGAVLVMTLGCTSDQVDTTTQPIQNPTTQNPIIEDVTVENAFELIQKRQNDNDFVIVDVRTQEEFTAGHIKDAIQIDYNSNTFNSELNVLNKKNTYIIYCRSGGRSGNALDIMQDLDFVEVYNILGGIEAWQAEGLPLEVSQVHNPNDQNEKGPTEVAGLDPPSISLYPGSIRVAYQRDSGEGDGP